MKYYLYLLFALLLSCSSSHLFVDQEVVDKTSLASSWVGSPDPRQNNPPIGRNLLVRWDYPKSLFDQKLTLILQAILWDHSEKTYLVPIKYASDSKAFFFTDSANGIDKRLLTYKIEVLNEDRELVDEWVHQMWYE